MNDLTLGDWIEAYSTHDTDGDSNALVASSTNQTIIYHDCRFGGAHEYCAPAD